MSRVIKKIIENIGFFAIDVIAGAVIGAFAGLILVGLASFVLWSTNLELSLLVVRAAAGVGIVVKLLSNRGWMD